MDIARFAGVAGHFLRFVSQRSDFDTVVHDEPYHAVQLYVDTAGSRFIVRVWGRTRVSKSTIFCTKDSKPLET